MAINFCTNCGAKLRIGAKFCGSCGEKIPLAEEKLPPMPYQKSNIMEVYAEKKAKAKAQAQDKPTSIQQMFLNAKSNATDTVTRKPKSMAEIYAEAKTNAQVAPKQSQSQQSTYIPAQDSLSYYKEDVTIQEKFFSTEGRLNRMRYFKRWLAVDLVALVLCGIVTLACSTPWGYLTHTGDIMVNLISIAMIIPNYFLNVRRIKDIGKEENIVTGVATLEVLLTLVQIYCLSDWDWSSSKTSTQQFGMSASMIRLGIFVWLQKTAGTVGLNKYGADPLENERRMNF